MCPEIIDLQPSTTNPPLLCPFDSTVLDKIIYFTQRLELGPTDEEGDHLKDEYVCMTCGYIALFYAKKRLKEIKDEVDGYDKPKKAELYDIKEKLRDSRRNQIRLRLSKK